MSDYKCPYCGKSHGDLQIDVDLYRACEVRTLKARIEELEKRLMVDLKGEPHTKDAMEYADSLVDKNGMARFGELSRLEWMLRVLAHNYWRSGEVNRLVILERDSFHLCC